MNNSMQREIARLQREIAKLEAQVAKETERKIVKGRRKVAILARQLGFRTPRDLITVCFGIVPKSTPKAAPVRVGKRARISDADRKAIISDLKSGKFTAAAVAKKHGVSIPTVALTKRKAGLTKSRLTAKKHKPRGAKPVAQPPVPAIAEPKQS